MTTPAQVTEIVAHYTQPAPTGENWEQIKTGWNQRALDAWLAAARQHGLEPTVVQLGDTHHIVAIVEVGGREFEVTHLGRRMELQAVPR